MNSLAIEASGLSKRFGAVQSLVSIDLRVQRGQLFGFLGPNGAGKTTTLRVLLGLVKPDTGSVSVLEFNPVHNGDHVRAQVGVLLETDGLYERLTAWDNLDYHARIHHLKEAARHTRIEELLRELALWDRRHDRVINWSRGMRQKLAVARALVHRPKLLLLDEPFSGMDPVAAAELRARLLSLTREHGTTVVLTTHDLSHVEKACDQVAVVQAGRVIAAGTPDALTGGSANVELRIVGRGLDETLLETMKTEGALLSYTLSGNSSDVVCVRDQRPRLLELLVQRGVVPEEIRVLNESLEARFIELMRPKPEFTP